MAQDNENPNNPSGAAGADAGDGFVPAGLAPVIDGVEGEQYEEFIEDGEEEVAEEGGDETAELASGLDDLQNQALNSVEVAKQLEQLTDVVLSSAEVSTRSASVAADVSHDMRLVMDSVSEDHKSNIRNSRMMVIAMLAFLVVGVGTFFAISTKMQLNIGQLDTMSLQVGKRIVDLDATVSAFTQASRSMNELTEKLEDMNKNQDKLQEKFEEINKQMATMPSQVADQSSKSLEAKLQALEKQIQMMDAKVQALSNRPAPAAPSGAADLQKLKKELDAANAKAKEKAEVKSSPQPAPAQRQEPKPGAKLEGGGKEKEALAKPLQPGLAREEVAVKEIKENKETKQPKPRAEGSEKKDLAKLAEPKEEREAKGLKEAKETKEIKEAKLTKEAKEAKESKEAKASGLAKDKSEKTALNNEKAVEKSPEAKLIAQPRKDAMVVYPRVSPVAEN